MVICIVKFVFVYKFNKSNKREVMYCLKMFNVFSNFLSINFILGIFFSLLLLNVLHNKLILIAENGKVFIII